MKKIHDSLDLDFTAAQIQAGSQYQQTLMQNQKINLNKQNQLTKDLKYEIEKMKDQIFILASEKYDTAKSMDMEFVKEQFKKLQQKIDKMKNSNDEAILSTKPWVCLSCDKEKFKSKEKDLLEKQKISSRKKISIDTGKAGGFLTNRTSEKNMKLNVSPQP